MSLIDKHQVIVGFRRRFAGVATGALEIEMPASQDLLRSWP